MPSGVQSPEQLIQHYSLLTEKAAFVDRSQSGKLALVGAQSAEFLNGQITADIEKLQVGHGTYAALLNNKGRVICDLRVIRLADELLLLTDRPSLQALFDHIRVHLIGFDATYEKRTLERFLLSINGPQAAKMILPIFASANNDFESWIRSNPAEHELFELTLDHGSFASKIDGQNVTSIAGPDLDLLIVKTDRGFDLLGQSDLLPQARALLLNAGLQQAASHADEIVRLETGRAWLTPESSSMMPAEAGIVERAVSFTKGCYIGQETVARLHWRGKANRELSTVKFNSSGSDPNLSAQILLQDDDSGVSVPAIKTVEPLLLRQRSDSETKVVGKVLQLVDSPAYGLVASTLLRVDVEPTSELELVSEAEPETVLATGFRFDFPTSGDCG